MKEGAAENVKSTNPSWKLDLLLDVILLSVILFSLAILIESFLIRRI